MDNDTDMQVKNNLGTVRNTADKQQNGNLEKSPLELALETVFSSDNEGVDDEDLKKMAEDFSAQPMENDTNQWLLAEYVNEVHDEELALDK